MDDLTSNSFITVIVQRARNLSIWVFAPGRCNFGADRGILAHMRHLSPRDLADALGVSESSLKRWVDAGKLAAFRTEGGHRRIAVSEALRFIRETGAPVARPELL